MKVLFITRKYPPQIGGMEKYSYDLINNFPGQKEVIALKKSQVHLFWFIPYALVKGIFLSRRVDLVYLCDSLLAPIGLVLKLISKKPVMATAHGLDIIYNNWIYKNINVRSLKYLDKIIAVSKATQKNCLTCGIESEKCLFIPNGINVMIVEKKYNKKDLSRFLKFNIENKKILLTVSRLTKRKGLAWFIKNVMPKLEADTIYLIAGAGLEEKNIKEIIIKSGTMNRAILLGSVTEDDKNMLFQTSDIFVMPNITKKNDQEGFGLSSLEASLVGLPVIASKMEGLTDAIIDNENGYLVESENANKFIEKINDILNSQDIDNIKNKFSNYTKENFDWKKIILEYEKEFRDILSKNK